MKIANVPCTVDKPFCMVFALLTPCFALGLVSSLVKGNTDDAKVITGCWCVLAIAFLVDVLKSAGGKG